MKKGRIMLIFLMMLSLMSCTGIFGNPDRGIVWLNGKTFTGEVTMNVTDKPEKTINWGIIFDQDGHLLPESGIDVVEEKSYKLKDNVLEISWIIVYEENNARCTKDIRIEKLPDRRISYKEKQTIIGTDQILEREGILFERM